MATLTHSPTTSCCSANSLHLSKTKNFTFSTTSTTYYGTIIPPCGDRPAATPLSLTTVPAPRQLLPRQLLPRPYPSTTCFSRQRPTLFLLGYLPTTITRKILWWQLLLASRPSTAWFWSHRLISLALRDHLYLNQQLSSCEACLMYIGKTSAVLVVVVVLVIIYALLYCHWL